MGIYQVNYSVTNNFTVYVESDTALEATEIIENIYQNNFDLLPEDGELDHDIDPGIWVAKPLLWEGERVYTREDMTNE